MAKVQAPAGRPQPVYRIVLTERATIVAHGEALEMWWVRLNDGWVRAKEHPAATSPTRGESDPHDESLDCPSGTVWQRAIELRLEAGTQLLMRQSWPRTRRLSVMGYLELGLPHAQRTVKERRFVVSGNYKLTSVGRMRTQTLTKATARKNTTVDESAETDR